MWNLKTRFQQSTPFKIENIFDEGPKMESDFHC